MTTLLRILALSLRYGGLLALDGVDMNVQAGSVHALIGPNGAGKTALFDVISGLVAPGAGACCSAAWTSPRWPPTAAQHSAWRAPSSTAACSAP